MLKIYAFVDIASNVGLEETGAIISSRLFAGQPFVYNERLRDEVPGLVMRTEVFGVYAVLYGGDVIEEGKHAGKLFFCLEILPGELRRRHPFTHWMGIGEWVAQVLAEAPEFDIVRWVPSGDDLVGNYSR